jgi:hypothetical protein
VTKIKLKKVKQKTTYFEDEEGNIISKVCTKCKTEVEIDEFRRKKGGLAGKVSICRPCELQRGLTYRRDNKEKIRLMNQRYYEENLKEVRERQRLYHLNNPHIARERGRRWRADNSERINEMSRNRRKNNPEASRLIVQRRLARKRVLPDDLTVNQVQQILEHFGGCALTGSEEYHLDHVIPLATGHGGTVYGNIIPLRPDLNITKSDKNIFEWFEANRQRFNLSPVKFEEAVTWLANANKVTPQDYKEHVYWCHSNRHSLDDLKEGGI